MLFNRLLDLLAPPTCAACGEPIKSTWALFCSDCATQLGEPLQQRLGPLPLVALGHYNGPLGRAIQRLKYSDRPDLAAPLGQALARVAPSAGLAADGLIPVPLHRRRLRQRGYNQAALLGRAVAPQLRLKLQARALRRLRHTAPQAQCDRATRAANVSGAYVARPGLRAQRVLLLDDVVTTGATARACAQALEASAVQVVAVLCLARASKVPTETKALSDLLPHPAADTLGRGNPGGGL